MSKSISIDESLVFFLDNEKTTPKDKHGRREESYGTQIKRLLKVKP